MPRSTNPATLQRIARVVDRHPPFWMKSSRYGCPTARELVPFRYTSSRSSDSMTEAGESSQREGQKPPTPGKGSPPSRWQNFRPSRTWVMIFLGLLAFNLFFSMRASQPASRVRVPYSPFFLDQVREKQVEEITSKGTDIQGTFTKKLSYKGSKPTTR